MDYSVEDFMNQAASAANQACHFDKIGYSQPAAYMYLQAASLLEQAVNLGLNNSSVIDHISQYKNRAGEIECKITALKPEMKVSAENGQNELNRAKFLLIEGLEQDEEGNIDEAVERYSDAVSLCIQANKGAENEATKDKLRKLADQALSRAEELRKLNTEKNVCVKPVDRSQKQSPTKAIPPLGLDFMAAKTQSEKSHCSTKSTGLQLSGSSAYTREELEVLRRTSIINSQEYVPFMTYDIKEKFAFSLPFSDKSGMLTLSPKQRRNFSHWARIEEISSDPKMIIMVDCFSIKQTCVSDCSFIASLAISALYEKRFKKRLITDIIYPKNKAGDPVYNPCGKYMIKLHVNGVFRKVVIDDFLPVGKFGELLCSFSTNKNEFWISLIEKAYMKVMGGYDFPGSNSNIDLYALTGWIPERVSIHEKDFNKDATFRKILDRYHKGDVLVTVATGEMSDAAADRAGLVSTHAYALLDIKEVKGKRLMLLKNPWSHLRWKGNYSELDTRHWTPDLCKELNYDPKSAQMFDNGVFWIDYDSLCHFFDVIYMNWNPSLFSYTYCTHQTWQAGVGPAKDLYNIGENPQYSLEVSTTSGAALWVLLTRHITDIEDFRNNKEYITLIVYKSGGKKVYYPFNPPPYIDGVRINSPHYLCKVVLKESGVHRFTLVVSQYEKQKTIQYSLRVYSTACFSLHKIKNICTHKVELSGKWSVITAGGCPNHRNTYHNNPCYQFRIESDLPTLCIQLKAPKEIQIGVEIICVDAINASAKSYFKKKESGSYRSGFVVLELQDVVAGVYNIIPSTFNPGQEAPYFLSLHSPVSLKVNRLK